MNRTTIIITVAVAILCSTVGYFVGHDRGRKSMAAEFGEMIRNEIPGAAARMDDIEAATARRKAAE